MPSLNTITFPVKKKMVGNIYQCEIYGKFMLRIHQVVGVIRFESLWLLNSFCSNVLFSFCWNSYFYMHWFSSDALLASSCINPSSIWRLFFFTTPSDKIAHLCHLENSLVDGDSNLHKMLRCLQLTC